jgi:hypothetical protein
VLLAVALAVLAIAVAAEAHAQRGKKKPAGFPVRIETLPAGASVFLGDKDSGPVGTTPAELTLPAGEHVVILELDGHIPRFESVVVEEREGKAAKATQTFAFELDPAIATLVVEPEEGTELPDGTRVLVDGEDRGEPPVRVEVEVGAHQVQVIAPGKAPFEEWVEVEGGQEHLMSIAGSSLPVAADPPPSVTKPKKKRPLMSMGTLRTGVEVGFRRFRYDNPVTANARPYTADGSIHLVVDGELHPWRRFFPNKVLDRISVIGGVGYSPVITATESNGMQVDAFWRSQHAGLRARPLAGKVALDVDAEWMHVLYAFRDGNSVPVDDTPDVDYQIARIGVRVLGRVLPELEAWAGVDNRVVLSGGPLEDRFRRPEVDGVAARAGAAAFLLSRHVEARVEGAYARYAWTFQPESGDPYIADGGTDAMYGVTITLGGIY